MRVGIHNNRRHANHSRLALPKFIAKCRFPCLRRYADSDSGSDLQQESLLDSDYPAENDSYHMNGRDWDRHDMLSRRHDVINMAVPGADEHDEDEQENIVPSTDLFAASSLQSTTTLQNDQSEGIASISTVTSTPRPLADNSNIAANNSHQLYQMPKFNSRMWQDGFGRFRRDTIPRRDNLGEASPVPSHRESIHTDISTPAQTWYSSPIFTGLGSDANSLALSQKSSNSTLLSDVILTDVIDEGGDDDEDMWQAFENDDDAPVYMDGNGNLGVSVGDNPARVHGTASADVERSATSQIMLPEHSSSLAQILLSLPDQTQHNTERVHGTASAEAERSATSQIMLPEHSSSLAQILLSLPDQTQHNPYSVDNQTIATSTESGLSEEQHQRIRHSQNQNRTESQWNFQDQNHAVSLGQTHGQVTSERSQLPTVGENRQHVESQDQGHGHPSLFEILDRLQRNMQDNPVNSPSEGAHISASQESDIHGNTSDHGNDSNDNGEATNRSNPSTVSSTWSNHALIQHIMDALTNNTQGGTTTPRSLGSTQSSASSTSHRNWYFYDRRLVPNRNTGPAGAMGENQLGGTSLDIMQPPSYEEAQTAEPNLNLPGINIDLLTQLGLLHNDPPPPYPGSDITPPPPYDTSSRNSVDFMSELTSMHTDSDTMDSTERHQNANHTPRTIPSSAENISELVATSNLDANATIAPGVANHDGRRCDDNRNDTIPSPEVHMNDSDLLDDERYDDHRHQPSRSNLLGLGGRPPPVRWNRGMGLDRWASTHNWASQSTH